MPADEYIKKVLVEAIGARRVIIGYDHHFGKNREGSYELLRDMGSIYGFDMEEIPAEDIENVNVSSTKIRKALIRGDVANQFLGYNYFLRGTVVDGDKIGRAIHFPTANIYIEEKYKLIPRNGVYAVSLTLGNEKMKGMLNIGNRPTIPGRDFSIEVHIFDFNEDIYGRTIQVELLERIRDEQKFNDLNSLEKQLRLDEENIKAILK